MNNDFSRMHIYYRFEGLILLLLDTLEMLVTHMDILLLTSLHLNPLGPIIFQSVFI